MNLRKVSKTQLTLAILVTLTGVAFIFLALETPMISDAAGYEYAAKRLASGNGLSFEDPNNELTAGFFSPFAFQIRHTGDSRLYLGFPPGFPLLLALPGLLLGIEEAVHYVVPILSAIGIGLTFLLSKQMREDDDGSALLAAAMVALMPIYWRFGTEAWSEVPSLVFVVAGYILFLHSRQTECSDKSNILYAVLAGVVLIFSLFIRYANITFLMSIAFAELAHSRSDFFRPSKGWVFYGVLFLGLVSILAFNHVYYGGITLTSYSPENGWYAFAPFSLNYALGPSQPGGYSLIEAGKSLWENFSVILLFVPLGVWVLPKAYRLAVFLSIVTSVGLYSVYAFAPAGINSRFLIPTFPFLAIGAAQGMRYVFARLGDNRIQVVLLCFLFVWLGWRLWPEIDQLQARNQAAKTAVSHLHNWLQDIEEDAVIMSYTLNDHIIFYGQRSVLNYRRIPQYDPEAEKYRYDLFEPCLVFIVDTLLLASKPVYYVEDGSPPLYNSKDVLARHYTLVPVRQEPKLFHITNSSLMTPREDKAVCTP